MFSTHTTRLVHHIALPSLLLLMLASSSPMLGADFGRQTTTMWAPFVEWSVENASYDGNPFDLVASVTFTHESTGKTRTTEMFFVGDATWRFRFTGSRAGMWRFVTSSDDPELNGHTGTVVVEPNPDPEIKGFLTHVGNRFAIQADDADDLRAYLFNVYMDGHLSIYTNVASLLGPEGADRLMDDARKNGFEIVFMILNHNWLKLGALRHDEHDSVNPDLETFAIMDAIITRAHARGMRWHFWAWGDEARKWTPIGLPGGVNGEVDRRLQRYIAARLGPLPGWSMGYGFDLVEWTSAEGRNGWASYLHERMGWDHLLCARGFPLEGSTNNMVSYSGFGGNQDLSTTRHGPADFAEVVEDIDAHPEAPSFYEERHSYLRKGFQLDMNGSRRLRWWQAMAGGLGGFYGFYDFSPYPYPNPEQFRTFETFWRGRFALDLVRDNDLTDGACLRSADRARWVLYKENTDSIQVDLSDMPEPRPIVAVDTTHDYAEISLGPIQPGAHTIALPHTSDWAIAIGDFPEAKIKKKEPTGR